MLRSPCAMQVQPHACALPAISQPASHCCPTPTSRSCYTPRRWSRAGISHVSAARSQAGTSGNGVSADVPSTSGQSILEDAIIPGFGKVYGLSRSNGCDPTAPVEDYATSMLRSRCGRWRTHEN